MCDCGQLMPSSLRFLGELSQTQVISWVSCLMVSRVYVSPRVFEGYCQHLEKEMLCNDIIERLPAATISVDEKY
ncbi:hypothetical protein ACS0TY_017583 [Phlomoides rotata]